mmetsp:Transcript_41513/g.67245  ORF Transcript_41513/g.67245 Transcript_41513/m.67245 type:complete len:96 (+) Transcript_41513:682-969(+)
MVSCSEQQQCGGEVCNLLKKGKSSGMVKVRTARMWFELGSSEQRFIFLFLGPECHTSDGWSPLNDGLCAGSAVPDAAANPTECNLRTWRLGLSQS